MPEKQKPAKFEIVMCGRDNLGNKLKTKKTIYRGDAPLGVEARYLKSLHSTEKKGVDVFKP